MNSNSNTQGKRGANQLAAESVVVVLKVWEGRRLALTNAVVPQEEIDGVLPEPVHVVVLDVANDGVDRVLHRPGERPLASACEICLQGPGPRVNQTHGISVVSPG